MITSLLNNILKKKNFLNLKKNLIFHIQTKCFSDTYLTIGIGPTRVFVRDSTFLHIIFPYTAVVRDSNLLNKNNIIQSK